MKKKSFVATTMLVNTVERFRKSDRDVFVMPASPEQVQDLLVGVINGFNSLNALDEHQLNFEFGNDTSVHGSADVIPKMNAYLSSLMLQGLSLNFSSTVYVNEPINAKHVVESGTPPLEAVDTVLADVKHQATDIKRKVTQGINQRVKDAEELAKGVKDKLTKLNEYVERGDAAGAEEILRSLIGRGVSWKAKVNLTNLFQTGVQIKEAASFYKNIFGEPAANVEDALDIVLKKSLVREIKGYTRENEPIPRMISREYEPKGQYTGILDFGVIAKELVRNKNRGIGGQQMTLTVDQN